MGQAVLHFEKHTKPTSGTLGHHIDRTEGKEYSYRHADLSRTKNNAYIKVNELCSLPYNEAILKRVEQGYNARNKAGELKAIRKDAVYSVNTMLSGTHEDLKKIENDPILMDKWIQKNLEFCKKHFGAENITRFAVHLDEKTPHIHCCFVPLTSDGRLSANDIIGTGLKLEEFQTLYAKEMEEFNLERGVKSDRKHHTTEQYRQRERYKLDDRKDILKDLEDLKQSDVFSFKAKKEVLMTKLMNLILETDETTKNEIEALKTQIKSLENDRIALSNKNAVIAKHYINEQQKQEIFDNFSLVDYFFYLAERGKLTFLKKSANEYYFLDGNDKKISVNSNGKGYFDHKNGTGGQKIKAVMEFEKLDWYNSMNFMNNFYGTNLSHVYQNIKEETKKTETNQIYLNAILKPNNAEILNYFKIRRVSEETIKNYAKQIHYQIEDKHYFGIGIKNVLGGFDLRSPAGKMKLGKSSYAEIGNGKNLVVFEGMSDFFTFIELCKTSNKETNNMKFIVLNSVNNIDKFIQDYHNFEENIVSILDAGKAGDDATNKILTYFRDKASDYRLNFNIGIDKHSHSDLNDYYCNITNYHRAFKANTPEERNKIDNDLNRPNLRF